jgi:aldehyde:ferredoxin oxidoreductase
MLGGLDLVFDALRAVTGWNISKEEWVNEDAKRILTLQRVLLLLGGPDVYWDPRVHDDNPPRFYEPLPSGPYKGKAGDREEVKKLKVQYFSELGWDELGIPTKETLSRLGLTELEPAVERVRKRLGI